VIFEVFSNLFYDSMTQTQAVRFSRQFLSAGAVHPVSPAPVCPLLAQRERVPHGSQVSLPTPWPQPSHGRAATGRLRESFQPGCWQQLVFLSSQQCWAMKVGENPASSDRPGNTMSDKCFPRWMLFNQVRGRTSRFFNKIVLLLCYFKEEKTCSALNVFCEA